MGLSFHYSATLKNDAVLSELIDHVIEIAIALNWKWAILSSAGLNGIVVGPPNCEPLLLCFAADGKTCGPGFVEEIDDSFVHVKTATAGPEVHKALIDILIYLGERYFQKLEVYDEGRYWETRDYQKLSSYFGVDAKEPDGVNHLCGGSSGDIKENWERLLGDSHSN